MVSVGLLAALVVTFAGPADPALDVDALTRTALGVSTVDLPRADDAVFLRRVWIDLAGRTPPAPIVKEFLADPSPNKRQAMIERLVNGDEFAEAWGRVLAEEYLDARPVSADEYDGAAFARGLRDGIKERRSLAELAREAIAAEGVSDANPFVNFLMRWRARPKESAAAVARSFLGVSLACAECHDHPFAVWKQRDFQAFGAFFENAKFFESYSEEGDDYLTALLDGKPKPYTLPDPSGDEEKPRIAVAPRWLGQEQDAPEHARRKELAAWVVAHENPFFRRQAVNFAWKKLFGKPLVPSLDAPLDPQAPATILLDGLAKAFEASGERLDVLVQLIAGSRLYQVDAKQLSASLGPLRDSVEPLAYRPLSADQLLWSLEQATGVDPVAYFLDGEGTLEDVESEDSAGETFGADPQAVQRWLALQNNEFVRTALESGVAAARAAAGRKVGAEHIRWLFYATLSREPSEQELQAMTALSKKENGGKGLEDVLWVLVNSVEFNSNH